MGASAIKLLGVGALLAVALALFQGASDPEGNSTSDRVAFWVADRDGCAVYGLDEDLVLSRRVRVEWPTAVVGRPDGGAWVLRALSGTCTGPTNLLRMDSTGAIRTEAVFPECAGLDVLGDGSAVVLEKGSGEDGSDRLARCDDAGRVEILYSGRALTCFVASTNSIVAADAQGILVRVSLDPVGRVMASADLHEPITGLDPDWALTVSKRSTLHRLDDDLVVRWSAGAGSPATILAPDLDRDRIWLVDGSVIRRLDEHGVVELEITGLPIVGPSRAVGDRLGGLVVASPGCVLRLDSTGRMRPGQGGFTHLVDVDRVP